MASLTDARKAIAAVLGDLPSITVAAYSYIPGGASGLPMAFTMDPRSQVYGTTSNSQMIELSVVVLVANNDQETAQMRLDELLTGDGSVVKALSTDPTFGGTVLGSEVVSSRALNVVQVNEYNAWGHEWQLNLLMEA